MYYCRPIVRSPSVVRAARNASFFPTPFFHPRSTPSANELAPFLRMLDDFATPLAPAYTQHARQALANFGIQGRPHFNPSFDVKEVGATYELHGDVPGFEGSDLDVEFTDPQTMTIRGNLQRQTTGGAPAGEALEAKSASNVVESESKSAEKDVDDNASTYSTGSYQKPTVEESEVDAQAAAGSSSDTPISAETQAPVEQESKQDQTRDQTRYWFQERSTGSFQRVFRFESRIDQDAVKASLKNGVLRVVIPKATPPVARKITVD